MPTRPRLLCRRVAWQLQNWRDDSTGLRYVIRPTVGCERRGWRHSNLCCVQLR